MESAKLARLLNGRLLGDSRNLSGVSPLFSAKITDLSAILYPKDIALAKKSVSGVILTDLATAAEYADTISSPLIIIDDFYQAFLKLKDIFARTQVLAMKEGALVHPLALVGEAHVGRGTKVAAYAVIEDGAIIEDDCVIDTGVVIKSQVRIGKGTVIKAQTVIGSEGFVPFGANAQNLSCLGGVKIEAQVRIGALSCVDRGLLGDTTIRKGALIDNMVHIGHDSIVGENTIIAAQSGLAGFVRLGSHVTCGGQIGIAPHVVVGDHARISGKTLVHCDIKPAEICSGNPGMPHGIYLRSYGRAMRDFRANK